MEILSLPPLGANCYVLSDSVDCVVIDPGGAPRRIMEAVSRLGGSLSAILLTHGHFDHVGAAAALHAQTQAPIYIHKLDACMIESAEGSLALRFGFPFDPAKADKCFSDGDTISVGTMHFTVLHTPGHTAGSSCFQFYHSLFSGDTIFNGSIGNFQPQNRETMLASVKRLCSLAPETIVYPGHESKTTIGAFTSFWGSGIY
ncbi:MAG: MBL fold metallo-hydrolase [Clostridia bacterium]|nr:MBL fold metallo-hydrolase [Clostridia bacterium]